MDEKDSQNDIVNLKFLENLLNQAHKSYSSYIDYNSSEDVYNQLFIWSYLDVIARSMTIYNCNSEFVQGQPYLNSMARQLKSIGLYMNDRNQCKSDGLIKLFGLNNLELLLLETSGCFRNGDTEKVNFDHHKDTKLHFWSLCYHEEGVFDLWREASVQIKPVFQDKKDFVPDLIKFCWEVKAAMEESMRSIVALKEEHHTVKSKHRYSPEQPELLSDIINPIILKLTKEDDSTGMTDLGPVYSLGHT